MSIITNRSEEPVFEAQPSVSINSHYLTYEPTGSGLRPDRLLGQTSARRIAVMAGAVVLVVALVLTLVTAIGSVRAAGAAESDVTIKSVHFDVGEPTEQASALSATGAETPASYRSLVVVNQATEYELEPLAGPVRINLDQAHAQDVAADLDGLRLGSAAPDFADGIADAVSSTDVHKFVRFSTPANGSTLSLDVGYSRPLGAGDYLLVQERLGDASLELTAVTAEGTAIGTTVVVGPSYQWNTGHGHPPTEAAWVSVVAVDRFATDGVPVAAVRVVGGEAEFKVLAFGPAVAEASAPPVPTPVADQTAQPGTVEVAAAAASTPPVEAAAAEPAIAEAAPVADPIPPAPAAGPPPVAAVGVEAALQPAIAVGGAGCERAPKIGSAETAAVTDGQPATYCFTVTNLGTTHLTDVAISDPDLGLVNAALPRLSGPQVLEPGQQVVLYHHGVVAEPAGTTTIVTATPTDATGTPIGGFTTPSDSAAQTAADGPTRSEAPAVLANVTEEAASTASSSGPTEAPIVPVTELALTGMITEPWVLVIFAMAFIFIGYTAFAAFRERANAGAEASGHDQLDALGFD